MRRKQGFVEVHLSSNVQPLETKVYRKKKVMLTSAYIGIHLHQSSGNEALFQKLFTVLT